MNWAVKLFHTWKTERNNLVKMDQSISYIHPDIETMTRDELNFCLSRFLCEIKKENGMEYPGQTLYDLLIEIQLYLEQQGKPYRFLNEECFVQIKNTLDHIMKSRTQAGIGTEKRQAQIITKEEENIMWQKGILGMETPRRLLDTLVYLIGLNFAFRAGMEHRRLRWENAQLSLIKTEFGKEALRYREDVSKTNQGGLSSRKIKQKVVFAFPNENPERCVIQYYKLYIQHW